LPNVLKYFLLCSFILQTVFGFSQNQASKWYFGFGAGLDFTSSPPSILANSSMSVAKGCASLADNVGNLLFYTSGVDVWNQSHAIMANGTGLSGSGIPSQSSLILKRPGSNTEYFIFTVPGFGSSGFNYSIVDMNLSSGQGSVTAKNIPIYSSAVC